MPTSPRTPAAHHYVKAEQTLATLGSFDPDDFGKVVECLVALVHATLSVSAQLPRQRPSAGDYDFERDH